MSSALDPRLDGPRTISGAVAARLRQEIVAGELPAGSRLRQVEIARRLGVSTTPVREALAALQREGLVQLHPQRGAVVFLPSVHDLREHYEIRIALEELAVGKAAERFRPEWAEPLEAVLQEMRSGPPAERYLALNQRFHSELYARSGRERLVEMIAGLRDAASAYLNIFRATRDFPAEQLDSEHHEILQACVANDPARASAATRVHLTRTMERVAEQIERGPEEE
jgi:DNA-binding GntR family transcriptional regulator